MSVHSCDEYGSTGDVIRDADGVDRCEACGAEVEGSFRLTVRTAREIAELPEPDGSTFLVGPLLVRGARTIIVADTGHGKTTLSLQLASAALTGWEALGFFGAGISSVLVIDLEQGMRSIKRTLTDAGLVDREDVFYVASPDGLALDSDGEHRAEIERVVSELRPDIVILDPYYKAHRGEANEERGVVDLMRYLDGLRAAYGFALVLPAHPRKDQPGRDKPRQLKLDDVAGSGAVTRGAEIVLALERLSHGFARLRILKDRDGDLTVGEEWPLLFTRGEGFRLDPKTETMQEENEARALELGSDGAWRISKEYATELGIRASVARRLLEGLVATGGVETMVGPPGRSPKAVGYRTAPERWERSGTVEPLPLDASHLSASPDSSKGTVGVGEVDEPAPSTSPFTVPGECLVCDAPLDDLTSLRCSSCREAA